jgi:dTDP-4-amino-4,6-dideoxygalactose transaminase
MKQIFEDDVTVNVHFIPLPMLSYYRKKNYSIHDYPVTYINYSREISLPVFYDLTDEQVHQVAASVKKAVKKVVA